MDRITLNMKLIIWALGITSQIRCHFEYDSYSIN